MAKIIEKGDVYFFYRNKVDVQKAKDRDDVQRFNMVCVPDTDKKGRMFVIGRKRLPEIVKNKSKSTEREWMMNVLTSTPEEIGMELGPEAYSTKTHGKRKLPEAIPVGEGRYAIIDRKDSTRFVYKLAQPKETGKAQEDLGILPEASFIISVKNPSLKVRGFPEKKPNYPKALQKKFADERWLDVRNTKLMNYEDAQFLLVGAHKSLKDENVKITGRANLFRKLGLKKKDWATEALYDGKFAKPKSSLEPHSPAGDPTKGGRKGGKEALKGPSASGIAKALKGIDFPKKRKDLAQYAKDHGAQESIVNTLRELPKGKYKKMTDVEKGLGAVR